MRRWSVFLLAISSLGIAQSIPDTYNPSSPPLDPAVADSYVLGVNDLLSVSVFASPELSASVRVDTDGTIRMPFSQTRIAAAGKTVEQLRASIAGALVADNLAVAPRVEVSVKTVESKTIVVGGAVRNPLLLEASWPMYLLNVLQRAGGPSDAAGNRVLVISGSPPNRMTRDLSLANIMRGDPSSNLLLTGGEEVYLLTGGHVYVAGAVKDPGAFALTETEPLTVMKAIALAHGWTNSAKPDKAVLVRTTPERSEIPLDLPAIFERRVADRPLVANDILFIPDSSKKRAALTFADRTSTSLFYALGYLIVR